MEPTRPLRPLPTLESSRRRAEALNVVADVIHQPRQGALDQLFLIRDTFRGSPAEQGGGSRVFLVVLNEREGITVIGVEYPPSEIVRAGQGDFHVLLVRCLPDDFSSLQVATRMYWTDQLPSAPKGVRRCRLCRPERILSPLAMASSFAWRSCSSISPKSPET